MSYVVHDGALLREGWKSAKQNLLFWIPLLLVMVFLCGGTSALMNARYDMPVFNLIFWIIYYIVIFAVTIGLLRVSLGFARGKKQTFADFFQVWDVFLPFIGMMILLIIMLMVGTMLFVIPGIIWALKFQYAPWLIVDKKMGIIDAFKKSSEMTDGLKWDLLGFGIVTSIVNILGMLPLLLGLFITVPATMIAKASLYNKLLK